MVSKLETAEAPKSLHGTTSTYCSAGKHWDSFQSCCWSHSPLPLPSCPRTPSHPPQKAALQTSSELSVCQRPMFTLGRMWLELQWHRTNAGSNGLLSALEVLYNAVCNSCPCRMSTPPELRALDWALSNNCIVGILLTFWKQSSHGRQELLSKYNLGLNYYEVWNRR